MLLALIKLCPEFFLVRDYDMIPRHLNPYKHNGVFNAITLKNTWSL